MAKMGSERFVWLRMFVNEPSILILTASVKWKYLASPAFRFTVPEAEHGADTGVAKAPNGRKRARALADSTSCSGLVPRHCRTHVGSRIEPLLPGEIIQVAFADAVGRLRTADDAGAGSRGVASSEIGS